MIINLQVGKAGSAPNVSISTRTIQTPACECAEIDGEALPRAAFRRFIESLVYGVKAAGLRLWFPVAMLRAE